MNLIDRYIKPGWGSTKKPSVSCCAAEHEPDPDNNPNRCMTCLVSEGGSPKTGYIPASDSMFFDTGVCGSCGTFIDVCDPPLLDEYRSAGLDVSHVPNEHFHEKAGLQLVRLRFRTDEGLPFSSDVALREEFTMEQALERVYEYQGFKPKSDLTTGDST